ncbi:MAG: YaiI/YqxD family protein [Myxococcales bacterium]|nr:YaiI/YqxD family protein [Myxococcales bacterium]HIK84644.1 YaiI/YqxD family protein [Myxococcales bacterium]
MTEIFVDGDACPVKDEVYAVASRIGLAVIVVANQRINVPHDLGVEMIVVEAGPDAADDWIAEEIKASDVVVTADIPLAARCLEVGALALGTNGREFTTDSIGGALATREIKAHVRETGVMTGGPPPLSPRDRSRFSNMLDQVVRRAMRRSGECEN